MIEHPNADYRQLVDAMPIGFARHAIIHDGDTPIDYRFLDVNPAFERMTGLSREDVIGRTVRQVIPRIEPVWIERYGRVADTSQPDEFEQYSAALGRHYRVHAYSPSPGEFTTLFFDVTELKEIEELLRQTSAQSGSAFEQAAVGMAYIAEDGRFLRVNRKLCELVGYEEDELLERTFRDITHPQDVDLDWDRLRRLFADEITNYQLEKRYLHKDGRTVWARLTRSVVRTPNGGPEYALAVVEDISESRSLEEQVRRAQRMESVGKLAGGIAHDFNNLLTIIQGNARLIQATDDPDYQERVGEIVEAGERATGLVRQLLAYSRQQVLHPMSVDLNELITGMESLVRRVLREDITMVFDLTDQPTRVLIDPTQFEQVLLNLVVNAADAMPDGGRLLVQTTCVDLGQEYVGRKAGRMEPGAYVQLVVSDTGVGMSQEVRDHAFEPFFTTKEESQGTGLGLATVYGIVKQSGGFIWVYSEVGQGTTFRIHFPALRSPERPRDAEPAVEAAGPRLTGSILVVEDEDSVRALIRRVLESDGNEVAVAQDGHEALRILAEAEAPPQLVLTDLVMPSMGGRELVDRIRKLHPGTRYVLMSGYAGTWLDTAPDTSFLQKPFTPDQLVRAVQEGLRRES